LFSCPKPDTRRVLSFINRNDIISFRHHTYRKVLQENESGRPETVKKKETKLSEVGPRFEMKIYMIKLGTIDMTEASNEWVLRPYMTTAKKRKAL